MYNFLKNIFAKNKHIIPKKFLKHLKFQIQIQ